MNKEKLTALIQSNNFKEPELQDGFVKHGKLVNAKKGDVLIREGDHLNFLPIVLNGSIRVYQQKEDKEILLYYVQQGQTCIMSLSSAYFNNKSSANGMATETSEILVLPTYLIAEGQQKYESWNRFIMQTFRARYDELLSSFGSVAFNPIQKRLIEYLEHASQRQGTRQIKLSHKTLANELGTSRVVVSRILKQYEKEGRLHIKRGLIELAS